MERHNKRKNRACIEHEQASFHKQKEKEMEMEKGSVTVQLGFLSTLHCLALKISSQYNKTKHEGQVAPLLQKDSHWLI